MIQPILKSIFGTKHDREMKAIKPIVDRINSLEPAVQQMSDDQLKAKTSEFKNRLKNGETLEQI